MPNSVFNAAYLAIVLRFLRDTSRKVSTPSPRFRPTPETIVNTVLLRPTPPGPLPIAACAGTRAAYKFARILNSLNLPDCRFTAQTPDSKYDDRSEHHVRQNKVCLLYVNITTLSESTQTALYDAFRSIDPRNLQC